MEHKHVRKEDEPPAVADKKDEGEDKKVEKLLALVEKSVRQTEVLNAAVLKERREKTVLMARLRQLEKALTPPKSTKETELPKPKDMTGGANKYPHPDGAVKGGQDTESTEGAITSEKVAKSVDADMIAKMFDEKLSGFREQIKKEVREEYEASTPTPWGYNNAPGVAKARKDLPGLVREIIAKDREHCGGGFADPDNAQFGVSAGTGNWHARVATARYLTEQFGGDV